MSMLQSVPQREEEDGQGVSSVYDAALARARSEPGSTREVGPAMADPADPAGEAVPLRRADGPGEMTILPMTIATGSSSSLIPGIDWRDTIGLVERAAATIKAYERRFVQLDIHTRALIERAADEQARLQEEVRLLDQRLRESEERAQRAEMTARDEAFFRWEAERRLRELELQLSEAEDQSRQSEDYLRRVHTVLAEL